MKAFEIILSLDIFPIRQFTLHVRYMVGVVYVALGISAGLVSPAFAAAPDQDCSRLVKLKLPQLTINSASLVPAGDFLTPSETNGAGGRPYYMENLPSFCRITAEIRPTTDSDIKIELWMPAAGWNGKFMGVGNGVWLGNISFITMGQMLSRGYAVASTDTGHLGVAGDATFALNHPEKLIDFGYRAVHLMTVNSKQLVKEYYGRGPKFSYWLGCSSGGKQGLKEAQSYPEDYNGIVAGAPALWWTNLLTWMVYLSHESHKPGHYIPAEMYPIVHQAVLKKCGAVVDVFDGIIQNPSKCIFKAEDLGLQCKDGATGGCLTAAQIGMLNIIYSPMRDREGHFLFPRLEPGSELGWGGLLGPSPYEGAVEYLRYVVHADPSWDVKDFDLEKDLPKAIEIDETGGHLNANDPNLTRFESLGGKIIQYMGWADELIAPESSTGYYDAVSKKMGGSVPKFFRLFMVPGMSHCQGIDCPDTFDKVAALEKWVEKGQPPDELVASQLKVAPPYRLSLAVPLPTANRTQLLCPYPAVAHYRGMGDIDNAESFQCVTP